MILSLHCLPHIKNIEKNRNTEGIVVFHEIAKNCI